MATEWHFKLNFKLKRKKAEMEEEGSTKSKKRAKRIRSEATKQKDKERSKIWNSNLLQNKKELENQVQILQQQNLELQQQLDKMKTHLELLVKENNHLHEFGMETKDKIVRNCRKLVNDLPPNSPYRRPILAYLMEGLEQQKAYDLGDVPPRDVAQHVRGERHRVAHADAAVTSTIKTCAQRLTTCRAFRGRVMYTWLCAATAPPSIEPRRATRWIA